MKVFVKNKSGKPLMPCSARKARILLKTNKAKIISYKPFTIQLLYKTNSYTQPIHFGIDTGAKHIGLALTSQGRVLWKGEVELRQDIQQLLETRKIYRRSRRNRKTRYRKKRFNRSKSEGWLPPSIESRLQSTYKWIDKISNLLPKVQIHIEVGKFDIQKMQNPNIQGKGYQKGEQTDYHTVRSYVFARDNYTCQICHQKGKILHNHHIIYHSKGGTNRPQNLLTVCTDCHSSKNHKQGGKLYDLMKKTVSSNKNIQRNNIYGYFKE